MTPICNFEHPISSGKIEEEEKEEEEEEINPFAEFVRLVEEEKKEIQPHEESIEVINLGIKDDKKDFKIGTLIGKDV